VPPEIPERYNQPVAHRHARRNWAKRVNRAPRYAGKIMTRFKELRRIEKAIENKDIAELQWSLSYCKMRLQIATMKQHVKHWTERLNKVQAALKGTDEI